MILLFDNKNMILWALLFVLSLHCNAEHAKQCGKLEKLMVKDQWAEAFGYAKDREQFGADVWKLIYHDHSSWRTEYFGRVRGDNIKSPEFRAHSARLLGGFDLCINFLPHDEEFEEQVKHLGHQHVNMQIPIQHFDVFRHAIMEVVDSHVGRCFDYDAWEACTSFISTGIKINMQHHFHWGYTEETGPATWLHVAPDGRGKRQSPINIEPEHALYDKQLSPIEYSYTDAASQTLSNNGHTAVVSFDGSATSLKGGPLGDEYQLAQFHLHWGRTDASGSEHRVNGKMYPAELHMVHFNSAKYASLSEAADKSDGLAVLGMFIQVGGENAELKKMTGLLSEVQHNGDSVAIDGLDPAAVLPDTTKYWTYLGSLTTPPLYESVTWIVLQEPIFASEEQLNALRSLHQEHEGEPEIDDEFGSLIIENYRPPQKLHGRTVRASFDHEKLYHGHWGYAKYNGPSTWNEIAPAGRGKRQSPIDIHTEEAHTDDSLSEHPLEYSYTDAVSQKLSNNGHTAVVSFDGSGTYLKGGPLKYTYQLAQFHLHWGATDASGSEHRVDGHMYPAELHMVHWNSEKYGNINDAVNKGDGLAVLGMFLEVGEENAELKKMTDLLGSVQHSGDSVEISGLQPDTFLPDTSKYWTYLGSLTTPPLYESVTWLVLQDPVAVSEAQLEALRSLVQTHEGEPEINDEFGGKIVENYRPPQPLYLRNLRTSV